MTLAVKVALNPNTTNQPIHEIYSVLSKEVFFEGGGGLTFLARSWGGGGGGRYLIQVEYFVLSIICFKVFHWNVLGQNRVGPYLSSGKTREMHEYVRCHCDMTEIMLKAALNNIHLLTWLANETWLTIIWMIGMW